MMNAFSADPVFVPCIAGPTGAGKTAAALALADSLPTSVVNADSRQTYRDFPLITAQPLPDERAVCPHLLYGFLPTEQKLGAGEYARMAAAAIADVRQDGRLPVLVGGTGLYFKVLLDGIAPIPEVPAAVSAVWRERLDAEGSQALHGLLVERDPGYAAKIHPHDRQRIARALEVLDATGRTFTWWHTQKLPRSPYRACKVGIALSLAELEPLLAKRIESMLERGALEEARAAMAVCGEQKAPGWSGIGCAEVYLHLSGALGRAECKALWLKNTRAYAKRQLTWFRADKDIRWFAPHEGKAVRDYVLRAMEALAKPGGASVGR